MVGYRKHKEEGTILYKEGGFTGKDFLLSFHLLSGKVVLLPLIHGKIQSSAPIVNVVE